MQEIPTALDQSSLGDERSSSIRLCDDYCHMPTVLITATADIQRQPSAGGAYCK